MNNVCIAIPEGVTATLDLNGYTLTSMDGGGSNARAVCVSKGANLTLTDSVGTGEIVSSRYGVYVMEGATFTMNGGVITVSGEGVHDHGVVVWSGTFVMNYGTINAHVGVCAMNGHATELPACVISIADGCVINTVETAKETGDIAVYNGATNAQVTVPDGMKVYTNWADCTK